MQDTLGGTRWPGPLGGPNCWVCAACLACIACVWPLWIFLEALEAEWHLGPSNDHSPFRTSLPPPQASPPYVCFYPRCCVAIQWTNKSLPRAVVPTELCQVSHIPLLPLGLCESVPVHDIGDPHLGPTTLLSVWLTCSMSPEDLTCPSDPC